MSKLRLYQPNDIHLVWDDVRPHIEAALAYSDTHTLGDIAEGLISGSMTLWTYGEVEAALVAEIIDDFCQIITLGGKGIERYFHYLDVIEQWAKDNGCKEMRVYGRRGWVRMLKDYDEKYTVIGKRL